MQPLSPSKLSALNCPRRYVWEYQRRVPTLAPFASAVAGQHVHRVIHARLEGRTPPALHLPAKLFVQAGGGVEALKDRVTRALAAFEALRPGLLPGLTEVYAEVPLPQVLLRLRVDYLWQQRGELHLTDWKTGASGSARLQLGTYLLWARHAFGTTRLHGHLVNLSGGERQHLPYSRALARPGG